MLFPTNKFKYILDTLYQRLPVNILHCGPSMMSQGVFRGFEGSFQGFFFPGHYCIDGPHCKDLWDIIDSPPLQCGPSMMAQKKDPLERPLKTSRDPLGHH